MYKYTWHTDTIVHVKFHTQSWAFGGGLELRAAVPAGLAVAE